MTDRPERVKLVAAQPDDEERTDPGMQIALRRVKIPWGLVGVMGVYIVAVLLYATLSTRSSPDYQAAKHYVAARALLGEDGCHHCSKAQLTAAYANLLEAARLEPQVATLHQKLESLNWRFEEHGWKIPGDFRQRAEAVAILYQRIQDSHQPILVIGMHDQGWDPDQLADQPLLIAKWAGIGGLGMIVLWIAMRSTEGHRRAMARHHELERIEGEIEESERAKRRGP